MKRRRNGKKKEKNQSIKDQVWWGTYKKHQAGGFDEK